MDLVARDMTVLVLVTQINHGNKLLGMLEGYRGIRTSFIHGSKDMEMRDRVGEALQNGELDVLISSKIPNEGGIFCNY